MNAVVIERQILLREAEDIGVHPPLLWGRFSGPELVYAVARWTAARRAVGAESREKRRSASGCVLRVIFRNSTARAGRVLRVLTG